MSIWKCHGGISGISGINGINDIMLLIRRCGNRWIVLFCLFCLGYSILMLKLDSAWIPDFAWFNCLVIKQMWSSHF